MTDRELVDALCEIEEGLTEWEVNFVDSITKQVIDQARTLSSKQRAKAEAILDDHE